jgi:hypothetical protein
MATHHQRGRLLIVLAAIILVGAACASTPQSSDSVGTTAPGAEISVPNEGGENEGHTPIGFPGMGTGLFTGDNLNARFPEGDGVQTYLTFRLPDEVSATGAILRSDVLQTRGTPFDDLGALFVERVKYEEFGPDLFDLPPESDPVTCTVTGETTVACDVTAAVHAAADEGATSIQFRLRFEKVADNDGTADLAMFFRTDSNTNEPGLFTLVMDG